jgi:probable O-glycosylation ligase (exosortase A-associated)
VSKHLIFMIAVTLLGVGGSLAVSPFYGVAVYYFFAVLRPQFIWQWSLPEGVSWSLYVAVAAMAGAVLNVRTRKEALEAAPPRRLSAAHYAVLLFGAWVLLTYFTARNQQVAYPYFIEYLKLFLMFGVSAWVVRTARQVWVLYLLTAGVLGYIAYEVNYIYFFQGGYTYIYRLGYGGLDNNGAGLMLAMGVPLCYFAWEGIRRWPRWLFLALIPVILHAVLMSYSRGAMVSLLAGVPLYLFRSRRKLQFAVILLGVGLLVPVLAGKEIRERFFSIEHAEIDESANSRRASWAAALEITKENPVFGVGIRNSNLLSQQYGADMEGRTIHSQYLQTAADSGLVALALYLAALVAFWLSTRRARLAAKGRTDPEGRQAYAAACGVEGAMVVFCVGAAFLSLENFELPYLMILLGAQLPLVLRPVAAPASAQQTGETATTTGAAVHAGPEAA